MPSDDWPLELGKLLLPGLSQAAKDAVGDVFWNLRPCCVGVTDGCMYKLRKSIPSRQELHSPKTLKLLQDILGMSDVSNIKVGDRFARARKHSHYNQGGGVFSAAHVLSEWPAVYETSFSKHIYTMVPHEPVDPLSE